MQLLPQIRVYERHSTTALNSYCGPPLASYLDKLETRLAENGFSGLLISKVEINSIAASAGIKPGMLILKVGRTPVSTPEEFETAMQAQDASRGVLLLLRDNSGGSRFVVLQKQ